MLFMLILSLGYMRHYQKNNIYYESVYKDMIYRDSVRNAEYKEAKILIDSINIMYDTVKNRQIRKGILSPNEY